MARLGVIVALLFSACAVPSPATPQAAREQRCLELCMRHLHPLSMARCEGDICRCWAPIASWEAPRSTTAKISLPPEPVVDHGTTLAHR